jgi:hypothetical protein
MKINTPANVAARLGTSTRRVQQLIKELGIEPVERIGKVQILSNAQVRQLERRKTQRGPTKKAVGK